MTENTKKRGWVWPAIVACSFAVIGAGVYAYWDESQFVPSAWPEHSLPDGTILSGSETEVQAQLEQWWQKHSGDKLTFGHTELGDAQLILTLDELHAEADISAMGQQVHYTDWWSAKTGKYENTETNSVLVEPKVSFKKESFPDLQSFVKKNQRPESEAKVFFDGTKIKPQFESAALSLQEDQVVDAIEAVYGQSKIVELPLKIGDKRISNRALERINVVMASFSTKFNSRQISRSSNIKLASETINGLVLLPGESFSFNDSLGKRTTGKGYKVAGVYVSGRHDFDVGGGICQVSTTLYNASIKAMLDINIRSPHSLPVPYVPLGQDAAVSFPAPNLKFTNPYDFPIAIASQYSRGQLKFFILGASEPEYEVKFEHDFISSWSKGEKIVHDGTLAYGVRKTLDKGGAGRKVTSYRLLFKDGELVKKEKMGDSVYSGGPKIIAVNKNAKAPENESDPSDDEFSAAFDE